MDTQTHITSICTGNKSGLSPWEAAAAFHSETKLSLCPNTAETIPDIERVGAQLPSLYVDTGSEGKTREAASDERPVRTSARILLIVMYLSPTWPKICAAKPNTHVTSQLFNKSPILYQGR